MQRNEVKHEAESGMKSRTREEEEGGLWEKDGEGKMEF